MTEQTEIKVEAKGVTQFLIAFVVLQVLLEFVPVFEVRTDAIDAKTFSFGGFDFWLCCGVATVFLYDFVRRNWVRYVFRIAVVLSLLSPLSSILILFYRPGLAATTQMVGDEVNLLAQLPREALSQIYDRAGEDVQILWFGLIAVSASLVAASVFYLRIRFDVPTEAEPNLPPVE